MIWPATIACGVLGLAIAHIPGGLLGALLGSIIDHKLGLTSWAQLRERLSFKAKAELGAQQAFFMLLGYLAKSTGRVTPEHIEAARLEIQRLQLRDMAQKSAIAAFSQGKECRLDDLRSSLRTHYSTPEQSEHLLFAGWRMALARGLPTAKQRRILQKCADFLGCSAETFAHIELQSMRGRMSPRNVVNELDNALQLLGVSRSASLAEVKRSYRRQVSLHHPDKLIGAGAKPAQVQAATEKTRALHHAYAVARKHLQH